MSISMNTQSNYHTGKTAYPMGDGVKEQGFYGSSSKTTAKSDEMKRLLKNLDRKTEKDGNPYSATSVYKEKGFLDLSEKTNKSKSKSAKEKTNYHYKDVSNKIRRAKTVLSAGQAVISAKRKVVEIRRKIAGGKGDSEELQLALNHAKRMEMAARKKKHHLELEEMVEATRVRDEQLERMEEHSSGEENREIDAAQENVEVKEDAIFEERQNMAEGLEETVKEELAEKMAEQMSENMAADSLSQADTMMAELNKMIADFGEEELKELEEEMEQLENLEVVNPHMNEEDLKKLKLKHRNAENKALAKADMEYLKGMIKHTLQKGNPVAGFSGNRAFQGNSSFTGGASVPVAMVDVSVTGAAAMPEGEGAAVDLQL